VYTKYYSSIILHDATIINLKNNRNAVNDYTLYGLAYIGDT